MPRMDTYYFVVKEDEKYGVGSLFTKKPMEVILKRVEKAIKINEA